MATDDSGSGCCGLAPAADAGAISIHHASRRLMPGKPRAFVDFVVEAFERERLAARFAGRAG